MKSLLSSFARSAASLLFPPNCVHCGRNESLFCQSCEDASTRLYAEKSCRTCALPAAAGRCDACLTNRPPLDRVFAAFSYEDRIRDAVHALKYDDIRAIAPRLGGMLADRVAPDHLQVDAIVPVPLHPRRLRSRGCSQSALLAKELANRTGLPLRDDLLARTADTPPSAQAANERSRRQNVVNAFRASPEAAGKRILLVDDVMTTGSTLAACASALKKAGAPKVSAAVLARELRHTG